MADRVYLILFLLLITGACAPQPSTVVKIHGGVLDLRGQNRNHIRQIYLNGPWEFYWETFLSADIPADSAEFPRKSGFITVPRSWKKQVIGGKVLNKNCEGFASYRLTILMDPNQAQGNALLLDDVATAYKLFVNGKLMGSKGRIGKSETKMAWRYEPDIYKIPVGAERLDIRVQVSNFFEDHCGMTNEVIFGSYDVLTSKRRKRDYISFFLMGSLLIMGLYHLSLFALRTKETAPFYFALFCLVVCLRIPLTGERMLLRLLPDVNFNLFYKLDILTVYLPILSFSLFIRSLFPREYHTLVIKIILIVCGGYILLTILAPIQVYGPALIGFHFFALACCTYSTYIVIIAIRRGRDGSVIFITGMLILVVALIQDILHARRVIQTELIMPGAVAVFIFTQALLLSKRFSRSFLDVELLTDQLKHYSRSLEAQVRRRTSTIERTNRELENANNRLLKSNSDLEKAKRISDIDIRMAKHVQQNFLPHTTASFPEWDLALTYWPMSGVSGDFYDIYRSGERLQGLALFDVSGHGVSSGLITLLARSVFKRNFIEMEEAGLADVIERCAQELARELENVDNYLTGAMLRINGDRIEYVNAGHHDLLIKRASQNEVGTVKEDPTLANGRIIGFPGVDGGFECLRLSMNKGDALFLCSDGLVESVNGKGEPYGFKRLRATMEHTQGRNAQEIMEQILHDFKNYTGSPELNDDLTAILLIRK